ncbi:RNA polymerase sigma factor [Thermaurantiacus sp.]
MHQFLPPGETRAPDPETRLFLAARDGDGAAFAALVRSLAAPSLALATRVLGNGALAEEAVQEALTNLWRTAARFDPERGPFAAWWRRILMNAALDGRRRLRPAEPLEAAGDPADPAPGPWELAEAADLDRAVAAIVATLPPRQRAALALFHGQGLSMAEIAEALDTSAKAVEGLLERGRAVLRERLNHGFRDGHER